jgi:hypothetical protein
MFENSTLRRIFEAKRDEVTGERNKLHNEEIRNLYSSPNIIRQIKSRRMRWAGYVARMGEERKIYRVLVGKPEGQRLVGKPRCRWKDGIRMYLGETGWWVWSGLNCLRIGAVVNTVMNVRVLTPPS